MTAKECYKAMQKFYRIYVINKKMNTINFISLMECINSISNNFNKNDFWKIYVNLYTSIGGKHDN